jgi:hypothetical protein
MTNVVACRPPDNNIKCHEGVESIDCCRSGFKAELEQMKQSGIKVLVPMGQVALNALGIDGFIKKVRGSVYRYNGFLVVPTYDLEYLLNGGGKRGTDGINNIAAFTSDLKKALTIAVEGWTAPRELFNLEPNVMDVMEFVDRAIRNKSMIALDIETTGLDARRGAKVVVIGLADSANRAIVVPMLKEGGQEYLQTWGEVLNQKLGTTKYGSLENIWNNQEAYLGKRVTYRWLDYGTKDAVRHARFKAFRPAGF